MPLGALVNQVGNRLAILWRYIYSDAGHDASAMATHRSANHLSPCKRKGNTHANRSSVASVRASYPNSAS